MKWMLFLLSLLCLWFAFGFIFLLPGARSDGRLGVGILSIVLGSLCAWVSSRSFAAKKGGSKPSWEQVLMAPPMVICLFALFILLVIGRYLP